MKILFALTVILFLMIKMDLEAVEYQLLSKTDSSAANLTTSSAIFEIQNLPTMYLCVDSTDSLIDSAVTKIKLVYGYIDSVRTPCMSEQQFIELFLETVEDARRDSSAALHKSEYDTSYQKILEAISRGEKNFQGANLSELDLMGISLTGAKLKGANCTAVDFRDANLRGSDFRKAILKGAYLKGANLSNCRFDGADLTAASFAKADLRGAKGLTIKKIQTAETFRKAKLDSDLFWEICEKCPEKLGIPKNCCKNKKWIDENRCKEAKQMYENLTK